MHLHQTGAAPDLWSDRRRFHHEAVLCPRSLFARPAYRRPRGRPHARSRQARLRYPHHGRGRGLLGREPERLRPGAAPRRRLGPDGGRDARAVPCRPAPQSGLAPANGTLERYRLQEWLTFISTEIHKGFGPLWNPALPDASKDAARAHLAKRFAYLDGQLKGRAYLTGDRFSAADAYLFAVVNWPILPSRPSWTASRRARLSARRSRPKGS